MRATVPIALTVVAAFAAVAAWAGPRDSVALVTAGGIGAERGVARIACHEDERNVWRRSRGIVVDSGAHAGHREIVLTTGHSLPIGTDDVRRDCSVVGARGAVLRIVDVWRPDAAGETAATDWTVLLVQGNAPGALSRLPIRPLSAAALQDLVARENPVRLLMTLATADQTDCAFKPGAVQLEEEIEGGVFMHSCRSAAGLSGSPILVAFEGEPIVIGFNIGHRMRPLRGGGPLFVGVGRTIDADIAAAVERAAEYAASLAAGCASPMRRHRSAC